MALVALLIASSAALLAFPTQSTATKPTPTGTCSYPCSLNPLDRAALTVALATPQTGSHPLVVQYDANPAFASSRRLVWTSADGFPASIEWPGIPPGSYVFRAWWAVSGNTVSPQVGTDPVSPAVSVTVSVGGANAASLVLQ